MVRFLIDELSNSAHDKLYTKIPGNDEIIAFKYQQILPNNKLVTFDYWHLPAYYV